MWRSLGMTVVLLLAPLTLRAQEPAKATEPRPPETLLAENSVFYFRFDGLETHRQAYEATALSQVFQGDAGQFLNHVVKLAQDALGSNTVKEKLLQGQPPDQIVKLQGIASRIPAMQSYLGKHGVMVGLEISGFLPPRVQATLVFPGGGAGENREALVAGLQLLALLNDLKVEESTLEGRAISTFKMLGDTVQINWWSEGDHLVCTIGTEKPAHTLTLVTGDKPRANLTTNPLFQELKKFDRYETIARGFIDVERLVKLGRAVALVTNPLGSLKNPYIDGTGLGNIKSVNLYLGFAGKFQRSTLAINLTGERQGLMRIFNAGGPVAVDQLPALPPDASSATVIHLELASIYDEVRKLAEALNPKEKEQVADAFRKLDLALGVDIRGELLGQLEPTIIIYNSPGEAMLGLGPGVAIKVKNPEKFKETLDIVTKSLLSVVDQDVRIDKRVYQGVETHTIRAERRGFPFAFTFALHKDWLVMGPYPHTVQGFVMRTSGKYATWKPSPQFTQVLAEIQKDPKNKLIVAGESDPRATLKMLASFSPFFLAITDNVGGEFDATLLPNFQTVTEPLFPNVTAVIDRGDALVVESFGSLAIPFDPIGVESYWFGVFVLGNVF